MLDNTEISVSDSKNNENIKENGNGYVYCLEHFILHKQSDDFKTVQKSPSDDFEQSTMGVQLCETLVHTLNIVKLKETNHNKQKKSLVLKTLSSLLCISHSGKRSALKNNLYDIVMQLFRDLYLKLSLNSVESLRKVGEKKRLMLLLDDVEDLICLMGNFMIGDAGVKEAFVKLDVVDVVHKLWNWVCARGNLLKQTIEMLVTYTAGVTSGKNIIIFTIYNCEQKFIYKELQYSCRYYILCCILIFLHP